MRNRRVNVYKNTNLNQVVTDYRAGTPLKNVNTQEAYKKGVSKVVPGGIPKKGAKVPLAGTRISRVRAAPIGGYRKTLATGTDSNGNPICCTDNGSDGVNQNGFTQEIYRDTWALCNTVKVCSGDKDGIVARPSRSKKPLIRSGMQYNAAAAPNNLRNTKETKKKYAFSYSQYQKNLRCLSYERSQEKYKISDGLTLYKKSGCNSCCTCCVKIQKALIQTLPTIAVNDVYAQNGGEFIITQIIVVGPNLAVVFKKDTTEPCNGIQPGPMTKVRGPGTGGNINVLAISPIEEYEPGSCGTESGGKNNFTVYNPNNKKFQVQGAVSSGSRLERLKLNTIQGSRIQKRISNGNCDQNKCSTNSKKFTLGYRSAKPRFVTNPNEGGDKTRGFVPTRWRQAYLAHGRSIGNIFQRTSSNNMSGKGVGALPYSIGSIKADGCCHPPNAGTTN